MRYSITVSSSCRYYGTIIVLVLLSITALWQKSFCAEAFHIDGYYLGASPEALGISVDNEYDLEEKFYQTTINDVHLYFVRIKNQLRVYRIVKEEAVTRKALPVILDKLKTKYGTPAKQQIKTSSVRSANSFKYEIIVKNRALWDISASQEFIAEVENSRIVFELIDHNPEHVKIIKKADSLEEGEFTVEGWDPDY